MFKNYIINIFFILTTFIVIFSLSHFFSFHNFLWLVLFIFCLILFSRELSLLWLISWGILLDLFSYTPFGFFIVILALVYLLLYFLINHFLTNKSLTTFFVLNFIGFVFFQILYSLGMFIFSLLHIQTFYSFNFKTLVIQLIVNLIFAFFIFIIAKFFSSRLQVHKLGRF